MKARVTDPVVAAKTTGGCSFEPHIGWWTYTPDAAQAAQLGKAFAGRRDALYIPTLQKDGVPVSLETVADLKGRAAEMGLTNLSPARGMWILSTNNMAQAEFVWIVWAERCAQRHKLAAMAHEIKELTLQDCVAWEEAGELKFTQSGTHAGEGDNMTEKNPRLWVVPRNDAEAVEIVNILDDNGEQFLATAQPWGASWEPVMDGDRADSTGLEPELKEQIRRFQAANPTGEVVGIELRGPNPWGAQNIDHHFYRLPGNVVDNRSNPKTSIEQVAELLGVELTRYQQLISRNDVGYIPAMKAFDATDAEVEIVRQADRGSQGITPDQEAAAVRDVQGAEWSEGPQGKRVIVRVTCGTTTPHSDLLFGKAAEQLMPVMSGDGNVIRIIYYGPRHQVLNGENFAEQHWAGGAPESGYFGIVAPSPATQARILDIFNAK